MINTIPIALVLLSMPFIVLFFIKTILKGLK